jgi:hypothetical protein
MVRMGDAAMKSPPPTPEERQQARAARERLHQWRGEILAARGGRLFPNSANDLAELRAEDDPE